MFSTPSAATPMAQISSTPPDNDSSALRATLKRIFGHSEFRGDQETVIKAILGGKDASVIWPTGAGKSMCYQLPAFYSQKTVAVVSPLISLMQDQVKAINAKCGTPVATFLGSAQFDSTAERDAMEGKFALVYLTPEKASTGGFLAGLKGLKDRGRLLAVAVDEAHCVSEWGHDFRPSYRELHRIREEVGDIPLIALTATATPKVAEDIKAALRLREGPQLCTSTASVDRTNLHIATRRKKGVSDDLRPLARHLAAHNEPTIVYASTVSEVETIGRFLNEEMKAQGADVTVGIYHASLDMGTREQTHVAFLTGRLRAVVATVAFGMGIDKPDVRRVVHYGAPKTFEEYYQQIGRAGRDGLPSWCVLLYGDGDFTKFLGDFYVKDLSEDQRKQRERSLSSLRDYAGADLTKCRRSLICKFFGESAPFEHCGMCDLCQTRKRSGDTTRDFTQEVALICKAVSLNPGGLMKSQLGPILRGSYKGTGPSQYMHPGIRAGMPLVAAAYKAMGVRNKCLEELFPSLVDGQFLVRTTKSTTVREGEFQRAYDLYTCGPKGQALATNPDSMKVLLPTPQCILEQEAARLEKAKQLRKELEEAGVDLSRVPPEELETGDGVMIKAATNWTRVIKHYRSKEHTAIKAERLEKLYAAVVAWRGRTAEELAIAPVHVLEDHVLMGIAYSQPRSREALEQLGVRVRARVDDLLALLLRQYDELGLTPAQVDLGEGAEASGGASEEVMILPAGMFTPARKWEHAVVKVKRGGKPSPWEVSLRRFQQGEHIEAIAASQESGKPIQPQTVCGHLFEALLNGNGVDLQRLAEVSAPPPRSQWERLEKAAAVSGVDVRAANFQQKDLLRDILGDKLDKEFDKRTEEEKAELNAWYGAVRWFRTMKCVDVPISWAPSAKRQRQGA